MLGEVRAGRREAAGDRGASSVQGRARLQIKSKARRGAHVEHIIHVCDAGRVEAQRLVESRRVLPRVERRAYDAGRAAGREVREVAGDRGARSVQWRARLQIGSRARGGAHPEHEGHGCDAGGVEAQRLVERRRVLPSVERRAHGAVRGAEYREAAGDRGARNVQGRARLQIGSRARGGAHEEHGAHVCDAGGVEAQRLVERRRMLPRVERRACGAGRGCGPADGRPTCRGGA